MVNIVTTLRPYFFATKIYFEKFPGTSRGSPEAIAFLRNYAETLPTMRSTTALHNFAHKEEARNA